MGIYMSRTIDHYQRYDGLVELVTLGSTNAEKSPALKLFLHVMENNYNKNRGSSLMFRAGSYHPETDGFYNGESTTKDSVSNKWMQVYSEFLDVINKATPISETDYK